jgi:polyvinyl alcohol dehydrogenase (cytochrome)
LIRAALAPGRRIAPNWGCGKTRIALELADRAGSAAEAVESVVVELASVVLWSYAAGSSVIAGPAIVDGTVYWGAGYTHLGLAQFTGNNQLYAFTLNGN